MKQKTPYLIGRRGEYYVKSILAEMLADDSNAVVVRTAGSHSVFDIIAISPAQHRVYAIQVKREELRNPVKILQRLAAYAGTYDFIPGFAYKHQGRWRIEWLGGAP